MIRAIIPHIRLAWVSALIFAVVVGSLLPVFGLAVEDVQVILFPFVILAVSKILKKQSNVIPTWLVGLTLVAWFLGVVHVRGYALVDLSNSSVYLSRLEFEQSELDKLRDFYVRYNLIAQRYNLPRMERLQRSFEKQDYAKSWLEDNSRALMILSGNFDWIHLSLPNQRNNLAPNFKNSEISNDIKQQLKGVGISDFSDIVYLKPQWSEQGFLFSTTTEAIKLPSDPPQLTLHYLAWLAKAVSPQSVLLEGGDVLVENQETSADFTRALRRNYLYRASEIEGQWKSAAARGLSMFYVANHFFLESITSDVEQSSGLHCAQQSYVRASELAPSKYQPELSSAILNNAAIARIYAGYRDKDIQKAMHWFARAAGLSGSDGMPTRSARLALVNMHQLNTSNLLDGYR